MSTDAHRQRRVTSSPPHLPALPRWSAFQHRTAPENKDSHFPGPADFRRLVTASASAVQALTEDHLCRAADSLLKHTESVGHPGHPCREDNSRYVHRVLETGLTEAALESMSPRLTR